MTQTLTPLTLTESNNSLVLQDISWEIYEKLLELFSEKATIRMAYYRGTLELMVPLPEHERSSWTFGRLIAILSEELGLEILGVGSTTWRSKLKASGKEADESFYIQNEAKVRGKVEIDLSIDPPPDLAIEIDTTHSSIDKMAIYAELNIPEVWRWQQGRMTIHLLIDGTYIESETSLTFSSFPVKEIARFVQLNSQKGENARMREFREWVRSQTSTSYPTEN
jgi:Uma2 family endonuclease